MGMLLGDVDDRLRLVVRAHELAAHAGARLGQATPALVAHLLVKAPRLRFSRNLAIATLRLAAQKSRPAPTGSACTQVRTSGWS